MNHCRDTLITGITARNSPQFHFSLGDMLNLTVRGVTVKVDVTKQRELMARFGHLHTPPGTNISIPIFPLNTDGAWLRCRAAGLCALAMLKLCLAPDLALPLRAGVTGIDPSGKDILIEDCYIGSSWAATPTRTSTTGAAPR